MQFYVIILFASCLFCFLYELISKSKTDLILSENYGFPPNRFLNSINPNVMYYIACAILLAGCILRSPRVSGDYPNYKIMFDAMINYQIPITESAYQILMLLATEITHNYHIFTIACTVIILCTYFYVFKKEQNDMVWLSIFLFICLSIYMNTFNQIRHSFASAILFLAYRFSQDKNVFKYLALVFLASNFQVTSVAFFVFFIFLRMRHKFSNFIILGLLGISFYGLYPIFLKIVISIIPRFGQMLIVDKPTIGEFTILIYGLLTVMCFIYHDKLISRNPKNIFLINSSVLVLFVNVFCYMLPGFVRLTHFLSVYICLLIPEIIQCEKDKKIRILYTVVCCSLFFFLGMMQNKMVYPYSFFWNI